MLLAKLGDRHLIGRFVRCELLVCSFVNYGSADCENDLDDWTKAVVFTGSLRVTFRAQGGDRLEVFDDLLASTGWRPVMQPDCC